MKKIVVGSVALAALAAAGFMLTAGVSAQQQPNRVPQPPVSPAPFLSLEGPGSSIGVTVRDQSGDAGVLIEDVREGTPATRAGLQKGDVVVEFDGERTRSARQFTRLVRETAPGKSVKMTVVRGGSKRTLDITPEARDSVTVQQFPRVTGDAFRFFDRDFNFNFDGQRFLGEGLWLSPRRLGVSVTPLSDQLATYFGVKDGVLVSEVLESTPAASAGLKAGDVITAANGRSVQSATDLSRVVRETQPGSTIELRVTRDRKETTMKVTMPSQQRRPATAGTIPI
jgi:S1-C subfamily serine protease